MNRIVTWTVAAIIGLISACLPSVVSAQGLIWKLPEDGTWVRFEGSCKNTEARPDDDEGDLEVQFTRWLTVSSVGRENVMIGGKEVPCRWIEIKAETGKSTAEGVDSGRSGKLIYKVLVPEHRVIGKVSDADNIPVTFIPIVKGYRKIGDKPAKPVEEKVLNIFPRLSHLAHYRQLKPASEEPEPVDVTAGAISARMYTGRVVRVTNTSRTMNSAEIALSEEVPFGIAKWEIVIEREEKDRLDPEDAFRKTATTEVEMQAAETGNGARSELPNLK